MFEGHSFHYVNLTQGAQLILWGMFKKIVIADRANMLVNHVFNDYTKFSGLSVIIAVIFYTIQLYTEFSGAMDIVRGSAQILVSIYERTLDSLSLPRVLMSFGKDGI